MTSRFVSIFILTALILPFLVVYTGLKKERYKMRTELRKAILSTMDNSELDILVFSDADIDLELNWESDFQFEFQNQSYEVAHKEIRNNTIVLWCKKEVNDKTFKEKLREVLVLNMAGANDHKEHHFYLFQWLKSLKTENAIEIPGFAEINIEDYIYNYANPFYNAPIIRPQIPPPDFIVS